MRALTVDEIHAQMVERLGLDPGAADLSFPEALACEIRRAAAFVCPASPRTLIRTVVQVLTAVVEEDDLRERVDDMLEALIAHGDLMELERSCDNEGERMARLVFPAPPSFVLRQRDSPARTAACRRGR